MSKNPYDTPQSSLETATPDRYSIRSIWLGTTSGTGAAYLVSAFFSVPLQHWFFAHGAKVQDLYQTMLNSWQGTLLILVASIGGYAFGGFVAASSARSRPLNHAVLSGCVCMILGAVQYLGVFSSPVPAWFQVVGFAITIPSMMLGAILRKP